MSATPRFGEMLNPISLMHWPKTILGLSLGLLLLGQIAPLIVQSLLDHGIREAIVWLPNSPPETDARYRGSFDTADPTLPPDILSFWLWNITNIEEIRQGHKPKMAQVGPYAYRKMRVKVDTWWDHRGHISVKEYDYHLPCTPSICGGTDLGGNVSATITTLNLPLLGAVEMIHGSVGPAVAPLLDLLVSVLAGWRDEHVDGMFIKRTVQELIWGFEDPLLRRLSGLLPPGMVPTTTFQLMKNMSSLEEALASPSTLYNTGERDLRRVWDVEMDGGSTNITSWNGCVEKVEGSDGMQFRTGLHQGDRLRAWVTDMYRSADILAVDEVELYGVRLLRFLPDPAQSEPDACHNQYIRGLMNITAPKAVGPHGNGSAAHGPPLYLSSPHFCDCDPVLSAGVEGLRCDSTRHNTFVDIEPITGIPLRAAKRFQLSSEITPAARQHLESRINTSTIIPIFWGEEASAMQPVHAQMFKGAVYRALDLKSQLFAWPTTAGVVLLAAAAAAALATGRSSSDDEDGDGDAEAGRPLLEASAAGPGDDTVGGAPHDGDGDGPLLPLSTSAGAELPKPEAGSTDAGAVAGCKGGAASATAGAATLLDGGSGSGSSSSSSVPLLSSIHVHGQ